MSSFSYICTNQIMSCVPWTILIQRRELVGTHIAQGTEEVLGKVLESGTRSDVLLGYTYGRIILPTAYVANIFFHNNSFF